MCIRDRFIIVLVAIWFTGDKEEPVADPIADAEARAELPDAYPTPVLSDELLASVVAGDQVSSRTISASSEGVDS